MFNKFQIYSTTYGLSGCALLCFSVSVTISSAIEVDFTLRNLTLVLSMEK